MKTPSHSLFAKLAARSAEMNSHPNRKGEEVNLGNELLRLLNEDCIPTKKAIAVCKEWGIETSAGAVSRFLSTHGFAWKLERAQAAAQIAEESAPADWDEARRRVLGQKMFELVASNEAGPKEILFAKNLELKEQMLEHEREKFRAALKSKLEAGLDALREEIKNNPAAIEKFEQLKTILQAK